MLIEFSVENFLSIKDRMSLDLRAGSIKEHKDTHTFNFNGIELLHSAVLYGANASGKSNLLSAINFVSFMVRRFSFKSASQDEIPVKKFELSTATESEPSLFEITFIADGSIFRYGFAVDNAYVHSEWLFTIAKVKEVPLFIRKEQSFDIKPRFKEGKGLETKTRENALFLSVVDQFNGKISESIMKWFNSLAFIEGIDDENLIGYTISQLKNESKKKAITKLLQIADPGIQELKTKRKVYNLTNLSKDLPDELRVELLTILDKIRAKDHKTEEFEVEALGIMHNKYNSNNEIVDTIPFNLAQRQSEGTKKMFGLSGPILDVLSKGKIMVIDELDARFHPLLTRAIVDLFHDPIVNTKNAQLIFATHDTQLLVNSRFRRDQIWFTEKDEYEATNLYSLLDFKESKSKQKVRPDASYGKDYILGRYGAIPFIGDFGQIFLGE